MSNHVAYSWPYGDSEQETRAFYERLKAGHSAGHAFPFDRYQVGLVRGVHTWFVAVLVLTDDYGDDSVTIHNQCEEWFKECGGANYQDYESIPLRGSSIESSIGADYDILESFGTQRGSAPRRAAPVSTPDTVSTILSSASVDRESEDSKDCPKCGAADFNLQCFSCGHVDWVPLAGITTMAIACLAVAIFWFQGFYWRWGFGLFGGFLLLAPVIVCISLLVRLVRQVAANRRSDEIGTDKPTASAAGGGAQALSALLNNMSQHGAVGFAQMLNEGSPQGGKNLADKGQSDGDNQPNELADSNRAGDEADAELKRSKNPTPSAITLVSTRKLEGRNKDVPFLKFTADSQTLISVERGWGAQMTLWNANDGQVIATREVGDFPEGLCLDDDGKTLVIFGQSNRAFVFQMPGAEPLVTIEAAEDSIKAAAISADGRLLATGVSYRDTPPKIWTLPDGKLLHALPTSLQVRSLHFTPNGDELVCGGEDKLVSIWSTSSGQQIKTLPSDVASNYTNYIEFDATHQVMVTGDGNHAIRFINFAKGRLLSKSKAFANHHVLAYSPDKRMVAGSGDDGTAIVWRMADGRKLCELRGHKEIGLHLALSNEPRFLVSSGTGMSKKLDRSVRIWSIPDGAPIKVIDELSGPASAVAISPNGRFVAFSVENEPITLLELSFPGVQKNTTQAQVPAPSVSVSAGPGTFGAESESARNSLVTATQPVPVTTAPPAQSEATELIRFSCPQCGKRIHAKAKLAGKQLPCPNKDCGHKLVVPSLSDPSAVPSNAGRDPFSTLDQAYLVRHDEALAAQVDASLDSIASSGAEGIELLVRRLFRDLKIEGRRLIAPEWGDMAWNRWLQLAAVAGAISRTGNPTAIALLLPLSEVNDADSQFFELLQPAVDKAISKATATRPTAESKDTLAAASVHPIARQGNVDERDEDGATELYWAARKGDVPLVKALLARGADPCAPRQQRESQGETPLHVAAAENRLEVIQLMLERGANVDVQDAIGNSPIQRAAVFGHTAVIQALIEHGADVNIRTYAGRTPLDWAVNKNHTLAADLLRSHGGEKATAANYF